MRNAWTYVIVFILAAAAAMAQDVPAAVRFQQAHDTLNQADKRRDSAQYTEAISLYGEAQNMYRSLSHSYPDWQKSVVKFRTAYCEDQIEAMLTKLSEPSEKRSEPAAPLSESDNSQMNNDVNTARQLLKSGKHVKARVLLLKAVNSDPDNPATRLLLAVAQCQAGKYTDALYILDSLISEDPKNGQAMTVTGAAYFALGDIDKAKDATLKALKIDPGIKEANFNMAQILADSEPPDKENAMLYYRKALSLGAIRNAALELSLK